MNLKLTYYTIFLFLLLLLWLYMILYYIMLAVLHKWNRKFQKFITQSPSTTALYFTIVINFRTWYCKKQQSDVSRQKYRPLYTTEGTQSVFFFYSPFFLFAISSIERDAINVESLAIDFTNKNLSFVLPPILVSRDLPSFLRAGSRYSRARTCVYVCMCARVRETPAFLCFNNRNKVWQPSYRDWF